MTHRRTLIITIKPGGPEVWPVEAELVGPDLLQVELTGELRLDRDELLAQTSARAYGDVLGAALFQGAIRDAFVRAIGSDSEVLHVLLSLDAAELRPLQWEHLRGPFDGKFDFLGMNQQVAFSRYIPSGVERGFSAGLRRDRLRALVLVASPSNLADYGMTAIDEAEAIAAVCAGLRDVPVDVLGTSDDATGPPTIDRLAAALIERRYALLHVVAHGRHGRDSREAILFLSDEEGRARPITQSQFVARLRPLSDALPHLIFFAACESAVEHRESSMGSLARHVAGDLGVPAVIAMNRRVSVTTAHALTAALYQRLLVHGYVDQALVEATAGLADRPDILVPALFSRLGARPLLAAGGAARRGPVPHFTSERVQALSAALQDAYDRRADVRRDAAASQEIEARITALRQQLRGDGRVHPGDILGDGRYLLLEQIGEGQLASVWRAHDREHDHTVAIKLLHTQHATRLERRRHFEQGNRALQGLNHPNIVRVLGPTEEDHGLHFYSLEHLAGGDLRRAVQERRISADAIPAIAASIGAALSYAHARGMVHRAVNPANVLLDAEGRPKLADFDLAIAPEALRDHGAELLAASVYVAPECQRAQREFSRRADIYSLAMTVLFMLCGADPPLEAVRDAPGFVRRLDCRPAMRRALGRALDWEPARRFATIDEFCAALRGPDEDPPLRSFARTIVAAAAISAATVMSVLWIASSPADEPEPAPPPTPEPVVAPDVPEKTVAPAPARRLLPAWNRTSSTGCSPEFIDRVLVPATFPALSRCYAGEDDATRWDSKQGGRSYFLIVRFTVDDAGTIAVLEIANNAVVPPPEACIRRAFESVVVGEPEACVREPSMLLLENLRSRDDLRGKPLKSTLIGREALEDCDLTE